MWNHFISEKEKQNIFYFEGENLQRQDCKIITVVCFRFFQSYVTPKRFEPSGKLNMDRVHFLFCFRWERVQFALIKNCEIYTEDLYKIYYSSKNKHPCTQCLREDTQVC